jgi:hypothetical protein
MPLSELSPEAERQVNVFGSNVDASFGKGGALIKQLFDLIFDGAIKPNIDINAIDKGWIEALLKRIAPFIEGSGPFLKILASLLPLLMVFLAPSPDAKKPTNVTTI